MPRSAATTTVIEIHKSPGVSQRLNMSWLREHAALVARRINRPLTRLAVSLTDDAGMTALHREHLGHNTTTDVLTFPNSGPDEAVDVDIAVCVDEATRQAHSHGHPLEREILLYILHGLLHCCSFDDHTRAGFAKMHAEEDRILTAIGVGATFAQSHASTPRRKRAAK